MASLESPHYSAYILTKKGKKYDITGVLTDLMLQERENGIAQQVQLRMVQVPHEGIWTTGLFNVHDQLFIYADTGGGPNEVFRGYIWEDVYQKSTSRDLTFTAYDRLIYLQESEEYKYFSAGKSTESIFKEICEEKGIALKYSYESISHAKLAMRGSLANAFEDDLLEPVRKKKGKQGIIRDEKGGMVVFTEGEYNKDVYHLRHGKDGNLISTTHTETMDGITTKVVILGAEKDGARAPIKAEIKGETEKYGTIQKIISSTDSDSLADLKAEANQIIKDDGKPKLTIDVEAIDIPWVRKGDKVYLEDGYRTGYAVVKSITHDALKKTMDMEIKLI